MQSNILFENYWYPQQRIQDKLNNYIYRLRYNQTIDFNISTTSHMGIIIDAITWDINKYFFATTVKKLDNNYSISTSFSDAIKLLALEELSQLWILCTKDIIEVLLLMRYDLDVYEENWVMHFHYSLSDNFEKAIYYMQKWINQINICISMRNDNDIKKIDIRYINNDFLHNFVWIVIPLVKHITRLETMQNNKIEQTLQTGIKLSNSLSKRTLPLLSKLEEHTIKDKLSYKINQLEEKYSHLKELLSQEKEHLSKYSKQNLRESNKVRQEIEKARIESSLRFFSNNSPEILLEEYIKIKNFSLIVEHINQIQNGSFSCNIKNWTLKTIEVKLLKPFIQHESLKKKYMFAEIWVQYYKWLPQNSTIRFKKNI